MGSILCQHILAFTDCEITVAGRNREKAEQFAGKLREKHPKRSIHASFANAGQKDSLLAVLKKMDLVIVAATVPDHIDLIAEAALETGTDMIDILVRGDVVDKLMVYQKYAVKKNRIFITQAGFHPGLPGPFIRYAQNKFDNYHTANVCMAMNTSFDNPESTHELIYELGQSEAKILKNGQWRSANYKDAIDVAFSSHLGTRKCYPFQLREIYPLDKLGLKNMGVYVAGFNPFVDNFVFPLIILLQSIRKGLGTKLCGKLLHWGIKAFYDHKPGIEFILQAQGTRSGQLQSWTISAFYPDPYAFTSFAIISCLNQYLDGTIHQPGVYLMGHIVDPQRTINDLEQMGVSINEKF